MDQGIIASLLQHPLASALVIVDRTGRPLAANPAAREHGLPATVAAYAPMLEDLRLLAADLFVTLGPGWMAALYLFYFTDSLKFTMAQANLLLMIYVAAGFAGAPLAAWLANRISKHRALMVNTTIYSLGLILLRQLAWFPLRLLRITSRPDRPDGSA